MIDTFFYILRLGLGLDTAHEINIDADEWERIYELGKRQAVLGILFAGAEKLPPDCYPPKSLLLKWYSQVTRIRKANDHLCRKCVEITEVLSSVGLDTCILKGQGVASLYPDPALRQSGDIDVWVNYADHREIESWDEINALANLIENISIGKIERPITHSFHFDWRLPDTEVEVHFRPSIFRNYFTNRQFKQWFRGQFEGLTEQNGYNVPSAKFQSIYLMIHIYRHLLHEGVGLRQVMDYAMLLNACDYSSEEVSEIRDAIRRLKMTRFAKGLMWVIKHVFGIADGRLIIDADADEGRFLLEEIMRAGNFGMYDDRIDRTKMDSTAGRFWQRTKHRARLVSKYPSEVLWDIPFRLKHWMWRKTL